MEASSVYGADRVLVIEKQVFKLPIGIFKKLNRVSFKKRIVFKGEEMMEDIDEDGRIMKKSQFVDDLKVKTTQATTTFLTVTQFL